MAHPKSISQVIREHAKYLEDYGKSFFVNTTMGKYKARVVTISGERFPKVVVSQKGRAGYTYVGTFSLWDAFTSARLISVKVVGGMGSKSLELTGGRYLGYS